MIHHVVQFALRQRLLVLLVVAFIAVGGAISFQHMQVDAYPDLSPPMVEVITQWPGHAAEEIERLVTVPTEVEMNGVPKMAVMRSISLYGLSDVIMTFDEGTDDYFARQVVFQRLSEVTYPTGVTPTLAPLASPSGLVYRYVIDSPDRTPQELKVYEDWVIEREYKQVPGGRGRLRFRRHRDAVSGASRPGKTLRIPHPSAHRAAAACCQQFQCRRRVLFARRPILLCSRPRAGPRHQGHRRRHRRRSKWGAGAHPRHR
jgi:hypothetical protein